MQFNGLSKRKAFLLSFIFFSFIYLCKGQVSTDNLCLQSIEESLAPVRPGIPGRQVFWNHYAMQFIYAPAFDFKEIKNAVSYKFTAFSFANTKTYTFRATYPWEALGPIWKSLPVGEVFLKVEGIDPEGKPIGLSGERKIYRAAAFNGPYPEAKTDYTTAAKRQLDYIFHLNHVQHWLTKGTPDPDYILNTYLCKIVTSTIEAMLKYIELNAGQSPKECNKALMIATNAADYLISQSEPPGSPLAFLPPTYAGDLLSSKDNQRKVMIHVSAEAGQTYLTLYDLNKNEKYLQAAINIANTLLKIQLPSGVWPIKMQLETGVADTPNYGIPIDIINFLDRISTYQSNPQYLFARDKAWQWTLANPLKTFNWEGQFEDVQPSEYAYQKMGMHDPCSVAGYLLAHRKDDSSFLGKALEIIRFVEDQFVVWEKPLPYGQMGESTATWFTPSVLEQYTCYTPIDASVSRVSSIFFQAYQATHDKLFLAKSRALANALTQKQEKNGNIPTGWDTMPPTRIRYWWLNCAFHDVQALLQYRQAN